MIYISAAEDSQKSSARLTESKFTGSPAAAFELKVIPYHLPAQIETKTLENPYLKYEGTSTTMTDNLSSSTYDIRSSSLYEAKQSRKHLSLEHLFLLEEKTRKFAEQSLPSSSQNQISNVLSLVYKEDIKLKNIKNPGCLAVLSSDRILVADIDNDKLFAKYELIALNIHTGSVVANTILHGEPFDIAVLPKDQAAVTLPSENTIMILSTADMSTICSIQVEEYPSGITYHQDKLYVVYQLLYEDYPKIWYFSVLVLNLKGDNLKVVMLDTQVYRHDRLNSYIAVSKDQKSLYITECKNNAVVRYPLYFLNSKRTAEYQHEELTRCRGLTMLDDDSLLVCSMNGTIHHISADLKQGCILRRFPTLSSIAYDPDNQLVYTSSTNTIHVFSLKKEKQFDIITSKNQDPIRSDAHILSASCNENTDTMLDLNFQLDLKFQPATSHAEIMDHYTGNNTTTDLAKLLIKSRSVQNYYSRSVLGGSDVDYSRSVFRGWEKDYSRSVLGGSGVDYGRTLISGSYLPCEPCHRGGINTTAVTYCTDCPDYMCGPCYKNHMKFKLFQHHVVRDVQALLPVISDNSTKITDTSTDKLGKLDINSEQVEQRPSNAGLPTLLHKKSGDFV